MSSQSDTHEGYRIVDQRTDKDEDGFDEHEWRTLRQLFEESGRPAEFIDPEENSEMIN